MTRASRRSRPWWVSRERGRAVPCRVRVIVGDVRVMGTKDDKTTWEDDVMDQDGQRADMGPELYARHLERRVRELERQVVTIAAAVDAASRMRVATPSRLEPGHQARRRPAGPPDPREGASRRGLPRHAAHRIAPATPCVHDPAASSVLHRSGTALVGPRRRRQRGRSAADHGGSGEDGSAHDQRVPAGERRRWCLT